MIKFSFLTYLFCRFPLEKCFELAQKYNFDGIELWGGRPHAYAYDMTPERISHIRSLVEQFQMPVSMYTPEILAYPYSLTSGLKAEYDDTISYLKKSIDVASALESSYMQITCPHPGYGVERDKIYKQLLDALAILAPYACNHNVTLLMEALSPSEGNLLTTASDLKKLIQDVDNPGLKAMLDVVPPVIANEPVSEYFELLGADNCYIHICNSDGKTEFHALLDDGVIPIADLFQIFYNYNYNGWCSLELLAPYFKDPELYLAQSARLLQKFKNTQTIK